MMKFIIRKLLIIFLINLFYVEVAFSAISQVPLFLTQNVPPIVMLTMGRDHKLYYEAYNDASDLNDDGELDIRYKPATIDYFGYFDTYKCYEYDSGIFEPNSITADKTCSGGSEWSGDFLNYVTTSRMDALRKVLYGGYRSTDTTTGTVLQRAFIPQDAHSWGKEYTSVAVDGYDIADYTPLSLPTSGTHHLFASTTLSNSGNPILRVLQNKTNRIWEWLSKERPVADNSLGTPTDYDVLVEVCKTGMLEDNCKPYSDGTTTVYKPTGILQKHSADDSMAFGLLTGSYENNISGGVLRKNISSFTDEIDPDTGIFTSMNGIVNTIDSLRIAGFNYSDFTHDGGRITTRAINDGEANDWGNPVSEMMYEGLRYFAGKSGPTTVFSEGVKDTGTYDSTLGLPLPSWLDPYRTTGGGYQHCAQPIQMVISDINPSYDTDQVPGSSFNSFSGDLTALDVSSLADIVWGGESEANLVFIGESAGVSDGTPSAKTVTSFKNIRGLAPEEPTKLGGYYSASIAYYGNQFDLNPVQGDQKTDTFSVALASPLPPIEIPVNGNTVTLVPFAKSVFWSDGSGISPDKGDFQPTNQIVDFYVETIVNTGSGNMDSGVNSGRPYGKFRINYEDVEQAADHDMNAIVEYEFRVNASGQVVVSLNSTYAAGSIIQHMGYVVSGTTADGTYLEVRDTDTSSSNDLDYFLDTPSGVLPGGAWNDGVGLPLTTSRTFTPSSSSSASFIKHDPLWYAAKWGAFDEEANANSRPLSTADPNNIPDQDYEWDSDANGDPDSYYLVTNAGKLEAQLNKALQEIVSRTSSSASVATNSTRLDTNSKIYQARFDSEDWSGEFLGFNLNFDGSAGTQAWNAGTLIPVESSRNIYSFDRSDNDGDTVKGMEFTWRALNSTQEASLNIDGDGTLDAVGSEKGSDRLDFIRGDQSNEGSSAGDFRVRSSLLGDVINSDPWFVGQLEDFGYSILDNPEGGSYDTFRVTKRSRTSAVYFGSNDGLLHAVNADTGAELFAYVPNEVIASLPKLTSQLYGCDASACIPHQYFIDGSAKAADAYFGSAWHTVLLGTLGAGGKALFALDVTDPSNFDETKVLWEISTTQAYDSTDLAEFQANLGYTLPQASILRLNNDKWAAVVANGYESANHKAVLYLIDIETGEILNTFDTGIGDAGNPNGLSTPIVIDYDDDRTADIVYAGDLLGNLWKFDLTGNENGWGVSYRSGSGKSAVPEPLYKACTDTSSPCTDIQPITAKPQVGVHSIDGLMVYFGTGKYYAVNDQIVANSPQIQNFYGIRDNGAMVSGLGVLQEQEILAESRLTFNSGTSDEFDIDVRVTTAYDTDYEGDPNATPSAIAAKEGWFIKLFLPVNGAEGERVVVAPLLRGGRVIFVSMIPESDPCGWGGTSWLMELDAESGSRLDRSPFDIDGDGDFTITDFIQIYDSDGDGDVDSDDAPVPTSGVRKKDMGIIKTPGVVVCEDGKECKYTSGTTGNLDMIKESSASPTGRQSWNQIK